MSDYYIFMKRFKESINALTLSKCLQQRLWEDSPYQLKQLSGVGMVTTKVPIFYKILFRFDAAMLADEDTYTFLGKTLKFFRVTELPKGRD